MNEAIVVLNRFLHLLGTIGWIGAMLILLLVILPSAKEVLGSSLELKRFMGVVGKRMTLLVNISIITLIVTGIILSMNERDSGNNSGFDPPIALLIKLGVVFLMVTIHLTRCYIFAPKLSRMEAEDPQKKSFIRLKKLQMDLVWINLSLGLIVLLLSSTL